MRGGGWRRSGRGRENFGGCDAVRPIVRNPNGKEKKSPATQRENMVPFAKRKYPPRPRVRKRLSISFFGGKGLGERIPFQGHHKGSSSSSVLLKGGFLPPPPLLPGGLFLRFCPLLLTLSLYLWGLKKMRTGGSGGRKRGGGWLVGWWRYFVEMEEKEESREGGWGEKAGVAAAISPFSSSPSYFLLFLYPQDCEEEICRICDIKKTFQEMLQYCLSTSGFCAE